MDFIRPDPDIYKVLTDIDEQAYGVAYDWEHLPENLVVRAMIYGEPAGFVSYRFVSGQVLEIAKLAVRETMRRLGLGSETMHWLIHKARESDGTRFLRMVVFDSNIAGCHFLAHHGFDGKVLNHDKGLHIFTREVVRR
jgi:GNAT superfamily N-acetyltransferase